MKLKYLWLLAAIGISIAIAACGGSSSSSGTQSAATKSATNTAKASTASGSAVKVMVVAPTGTQAVNAPELVQAFNASIKMVNATGGLNGHKVVGIYCNDQNNPNLATNCGREAVSDHVVATVGDFSEVPSSRLQIQQRASIPAVGILPETSADFKSPIAFPLTGASAAIFVGQAEWQKMMGSKKVALISYDLPAALQSLSFIQKGLKAWGVGQTAPIYVTAGAPSVTAQAEQATSSGADGTSLVVAPQDAAKLIEALHQTGKNLLTTVAGVELTPQTLKSLGSLANGIYTLTNYPPPGSPSVRQVQSDFNKYGPVSAIDDLSINEWVSFKLLQSVTKGMKDITGPNVLAAMRKVHDFSAGPVTDYTTEKPPALKSLPRLFNPIAFVSEIKNGKPVLAQSKPLNPFTVNTGL